jgi:hypothetical protein
MDPVTLGLAGASILGGLFGGDDSGAQERRSFKNTAVDPVMTLRDALDSIKRMGMSLGSAPPTKLSGIQMKKPSPVNIPGIPFQIGGGLGVDPGQGDPAYLNPYALAEQIFKPMGGQAGGSGAVSSKQPGGIYGTGVSAWDAMFNKSGRDMFNKGIASNQDQGSRL